MDVFGVEVDLADDIHPPPLPVSLNKPPSIPTTQLPATAPNRRLSPDPSVSPPSHETDIAMCSTPPSLSPRASHVLLSEGASCMDVDGQAGRPQAGRPQAERLQARQPQTERPQAERPQAERPQAERPQAERPQVEKTLVSFSVTNTPMRHGPMRATVPTFNPHSNTNANTNPHHIPKRRKPRSRFSLAALMRRRPALKHLAGGAHKDDGDGERDLIDGCAKMSISSSTVTSSLDGEDEKAAHGGVFEISKTTVSVNAHGKHTPAALYPLGSSKGAKRQKLQRSSSSIGGTDDVAMAGDEKGGELEMEGAEGAEGVQQQEITTTCVNVSAMTSPSTIPIHPATSTTAIAGKALGKDKGKDKDKDISMENESGERQLIRMLEEHTRLQRRLDAATRGVDAAVRDVFRLHGYRYGGGAAAKCEQHRALQGRYVARLQEQEAARAAVRALGRAIDARKRELRRNGSVRTSSSSRRKQGNGVGSVGGGAETGGVLSSIMDCAICLEPIAASERFANPCAHVFHVSCMRAWLAKNRTCPLCMTPVDGNVNGGTSVRAGVGVGVGVGVGLVNGK